MNTLTDTLTLTATFDPLRAALIGALALLGAALVWWEPWGRRHDHAATLADLDVGDLFCEHPYGPTLTVTGVTGSQVRPDLVHVRYAETFDGPAVAHRPPIVGTWTGPRDTPLDAWEPAAKAPTA